MMECINSYRALTPKSPTSEKHRGNPSHCQMCEWPLYSCNLLQMMVFPHLQWPQHPLLWCEAVAPHFIIPGELAVVYSGQPIFQLFLHCIAHLLALQFIIVLSSRLWISWLATRGFVCFLQQRWSVVPLRRARLCELDGSIFIQAHVTSSSNLFTSFQVHGSVNSSVVTSSMKLQIEGSICPICSFIPPMVFLAPMRIIPKAATKRIGGMEHPMTILTSSCCCYVKSWRLKHIWKSLK